MESSHPAVTPFLCIAHTKKKSHLCDTEKKMYLCME